MSLEIHSKYLDLLQCVHCNGGKLIVESGKLTCERCSHIYPVRKGIPDLRPSLALPLPKIYCDPDYLLWLKMQASSKNCFYHSMKIMSFIQNAGHRAVKSLQKGKHYNISLDLGCGDGQHYPYLNPQDGCFGLDSDQQSLEQLRSNYPDYFVVRGDAYNLPIRAQSIDRIINIYNVEHLIYLDKALEEMGKVLSQKGDVFISVPTEGSYLWSMGRSLTTFRKFTTPSFNYKRAVEIDHINCIWQIEKALKRHFDIKKRVCFPCRIPIFHVNLVITYQCVARK